MIYLTMMNVGCFVVSLDKILLFKGLWQTLKVLPRLQLVYSKQSLIRTFKLGAPHYQILRGSKVANHQI